MSSPLTPGRSARRVAAALPDQATRRWRRRRATLCASTCAHFARTQRRGASAQHKGARTRCHLSKHTVRLPSSTRVKPKGTSEKAGLTLALPGAHGAAAAAASAVAAVAVDLGDALPHTAITPIPTLVSHPVTKHAPPPPGGCSGWPQRVAAPSAAVSTKPAHNPRCFADSCIAARSPQAHQGKLIDPPSDGVLMSTSGQQRCLGRREGGAARLTWEAWARQGRGILAVFRV